MAQEKRPLSLNFAVIAIIASGIAIIFALVIVPLLTTNAQELQNVERRIVALDSKYDYESGRTVTKVNYVRLGEMEPNTASWFLDPFGNTMEGTAAYSVKLKPGAVLNQADFDLIKNNESFEFYSVIRLPEWLGGSRNDLSAYRAYSAVAISDQCLSKYWGSEGRWRIENPCAGDLYRPWDGVATAGPAAVGITGGGIITRGYFNALASLDLSVDSEGYITAKRPNKDYFANGLAGEGRKFTTDIIRKSNEKMLSAASEYVEYRLPFVTSVSPSHYLSDLRPTSDSYWLEYPDYEITTVLEAVYYSSPSSGEAGYGEVVIRSYPIDIFPSFSFDSPKMTTEGIDPSIPDLDNKEFIKLNQTVVNSLIQLDWYDNVNNKTRAIESGTNIAGNFSVFIAPMKIGPSDEAVGAGALIWGKSIDDKKDILVTIRASSMDMDELIALGKSIPLS